MKTLTLLRHAKSDWGDPVARDFERPLNQRGRRAARTMGRAMRDEGLAFDRVVASPATRVIETIADIEDGYGTLMPPVFDRRIYLASVATLLDMIHETHDGADRLLIVGHNPGLENLALLLTRGDDRPCRAQLALKYPTATLAEIALPVDRWADVAQGMGGLARFIRPRDLDPELGPDGDRR